MRILSAFRKVSKSCHGLPEAPLSMTCRGKRPSSSQRLSLNTQTGVSIPREDLFAYTNGHFLVDEEFQLARRYVRLDLDALCNVAATAGGNISRIAAIEKMEGGFSKAFLMRKTNGTEVIAKIPCRIAGPPSLTTAGEVGALEYGMCALNRYFEWLRLC